LAYRPQERSSFEARRALP